MGNSSWKSVDVEFIEEKKSEMTGRLHAHVYPIRIDRENPGSDSWFNAVRQRAEGGADTGVSNFLEQPKDFHFVSAWLQEVC